MAATKKQVVAEETLEEFFGNETNIDESTMTIHAAEKEKGYTGPRVTVYLPKLEEEGAGLKVDQYEHVTLANEDKETLYRVKRGERVEVPVPVFILLKEKYPDL